MPPNANLVEYRDRAILKLYLYSGIRLATGCQPRVEDLHQDGDEATVRLHEKGNKRRTVGLHFAALRLSKDISPMPASPPVPSSAPAVVLTTIGSPTARWLK